MPATVPGQVEAQVLSSRSIKLRWTITYAPEQELIEGFFVGYRSFDASSLLADPQQVGAGLVAGSSAATATAKQALERPTFTYKTIRLTNSPSSAGQQQPAAAAAATADYNEPSASGASESQQQHQHQQQSAASSTPLLSPVSTLTKTVGGAPNVQQQQQQPNLRQQQVVVVSSFEYVIGALDRNTEYTILIQCFNRKGAGPASDPVVFKTFQSGEYIAHREVVSSRAWNGAMHQI